MIQIRAKISRIRNTGKTFKKMLIKIDSLCIEFENLHSETILRNNLYEISRKFAKFRKMYWYLKNLHNETISRNNLYEIGFCEISRKKVQRNFAEFREIKITFVVISFFRNKKILFRDHPNWDLPKAGIFYSIT
jgi:hypothetical protein